MWYVYILLCKDKSLYTGISTNPKDRLIKHQTGRGGKYTRSHKPIKIIYQEKFSTKNLALKREREIKSWKREEKIKKLKLLPQMV